MGGNARGLKDRCLLVGPVGHFAAQDQRVHPLADNRSYLVKRMAFFAGAIVAVISCLRAADTYASVMMGNPATTVSFVEGLAGDIIENVDVDYSSWSTGDNMVSLGTTSFTILEGLGTVSASKGGLPETITQRGYRGLGIDPQERDEIDTVNAGEVMSVSFERAVNIESIEVRSLFDSESGGDEFGRVDFYRNGALVKTLDFSADPAGGSIGELVFGAKVWTDEMRFYVPDPGDGSANFSEFSLAKFSLVTVPEPAAVFVWSVLGVLGGVLLSRRNRKRRA